MFKSLKVRIALSSFAILLCFLGLLGGSVYHWIQERLWQEFDDALELSVRSIATQVGVEHGFLEIYHDRVRPLESSPGIVAIQIMNQRGGIAYGEKTEYEFFRYDVKSEPSFSIQTVDVEGESVRAASLVFAAFDEYRRPNQKEDPYYASIILAKDSAPLLATLAAFARIVFWSVLGCALLGAILLVVLVYFFIRPIDCLADAIRDIDQDQMETAIQVKSLPSESVPVQEALNSLMQSLKAAFDREKAFTSHVSHELRTPLTGLRTTLEVTLANSESLEESRRAEETCLSIVKQTQRLVEKLLGLTRLRSSDGVIEDTELVNVRETFGDSWEAFGGAAQDKAITVSWDCDSRLQVDVPYDFFLVIINNLLENAVNYCPVRGAVHVSLFEQAGRVHISVENTVSNLDEDDVAKLFDPFWRKDSARTETGTHAGLGLAISQTMAIKCGGDLRAELVAGDRLRFTFSLDAAEEAAQSVNTSMMI